MHSRTPIRWSLAVGADPEWRRWDDEFVVHHALANDTHRLSAPAGRALEYLATVGSIDSLDLAHACAIGEDQASETLTALAELGFVEQC